MYLAVETLSHGEQLYGDLLDRLRDDAHLVARMRTDAESSPDELDVPGTQWSVVLTAAGVPAAWCAATPDGAGQLVCHSNYEVPAYRGLGLYAAAYHARHRDVLLQFKRPAVTYLFPEPVPLHVANRWVPDTTPAGVGTSRPYPGGPIHHWQRLTWAP
jgi:hypothetical protein